MEIVECEVYLRSPRALPAIKDALYNIKRTIINFDFRQIVNKKFENPALPGEIEFLRICVTSVNLENLDWKNVTLSYQFVVLEESLCSPEILDNGEDGDSATASHVWVLPSRLLDGNWESLHFEGNTKQRLLSYAKTCLQLGKRGVDPNIILCNRLILLHGPPGTGKTTICRALAQKLSIRLNEDYVHTQLVEVNCHSLFSKWFSESGKLVSKMFSSIRQYAEDPQVLVVILIDEVESLASARQSAINGNEPSDCIRVVNAVLTQLDSIRFLPNVLVLATSNLTEAIDSAFTDRADIIQYVGLPGPNERILIIESCLDELKRAGVLSKSPLSDGESKLESELMNKIGDDCNGLSGRAIRKLPVIALAESQPGASNLHFLMVLQTASRQLVKERTHFKC